MKQEPPGSNRSEDENRPEKKPARRGPSGSYSLGRGNVTRERPGRIPQKIQDRLKNLTDQQVIQEVLAGDQDRFRELMDRHAEGVFALTIKMVNSPFDAEDLTQQTFTEVFEALRRYDPARPFRTWLLRIATNNCLDFLKNHKRREQPFGESAEFDRALFSSRFYSPEQWLTTDRRWSQLIRALHAMSPKYRIPLVLKDMEGLSYREMQEVLDLPEGTLRIQVHRARKKLAVILKRLELSSTLKVKGRV